MPQKKAFNLFVYGTLMNPLVFRAVIGRRLVFFEQDHLKAVPGSEPLRAADVSEVALARDGVLDGYKKITPDNTYVYAVPDTHGRIRGYLIGPLPGECMTALRKYEGRNYSRRTLYVHTRQGLEKAVAFVGNLQKMEHSFGYPFRDPFKQEVLLRDKIEAALLETEREQLHTDESIARRALGELHGKTIRDLTRRHFEAGGISDYAIKRSIKGSQLPDFTRALAAPSGRRLMPNYLALVIRQVIFNQLEEKVRRDFRYELDQMNLDGLFYERTVSSLAVLKMLNESAVLMDLLTADCLTDLPLSQTAAPRRLLDFVRWAVAAADAVYEYDLARQQITYVRTHSGGGAIPLGAELEFSNTGHTVIADPQAAQVCDSRYDGFLYFPDFAMDVLTWKLGGHIDDHHEKSSNRPRRGFFELALGSLSVEANLSKPITNDPWILNQIVQETIRFYDIAPHSLHISLQLRSQHKPGKDRLLPLEFLQCLLALGGDARKGDDGRVRITRLAGQEIIRPEPQPHLVFCDISRRHSRDDSDGLAARAPGAAPYVQQFKYLRLSGGINYEAVAMALKGIQLSLRPGSFLTASQYETSPRHREMFDELLRWGNAPQPLGEMVIERFLSAIYDGLMNEHRGQAAHSESYIAWSLSRLRQMLKQFNELLATGR